MPLVDLLVEAHLLEPRLVPELLKTLDLYGGSLDTNILEMGIIDERTLQPLLEKAAGVTNRVDPWSNPDPEALELLTRAQAAKYCVVPFRVAGKVLDVLSNDPFDVRVLDEVCFASGCRVVVNVASEMRIAIHLHRAYGVPLPARLKSLAEGRVWPKPELAATRTRRIADVATSANSVDEGWNLDGIEIGIGFDAAALSAIAPSAPPAAFPPPTPPPAPFAPLSPAPPAVTPPAVTPPAVTPPAVTPPAVTPPAPVLPLSTVAAPAHESAVQRSYGELAARLAANQGRHELGPIALSYLATLVRRVVLFKVDKQQITGWSPASTRPSSPAILFKVDKQQITGWDVHAPRLRREAVERIAVPLAKPSVFARVVSSGVPFTGALPRDAVEENLVIKLGGEEWPEHALIVPARVRDRVVALLYGEAVSAHALGEALAPFGVIAALLGQSLTRLLLAKKKRSSG